MMQLYHYLNHILLPGVFCLDRFLVLLHLFWFSFSIDGIYYIITIVIVSTCKCHIVTNCCY